MSWLCRKKPCVVVVGVRDWMSVRSSRWTPGMCFKPSCPPRLSTLRTKLLCIQRSRRWKMSMGWAGTVASKVGGCDVRSLSYRLHIVADYRCRCEDFVTFAAGTSLTFLGRQLIGQHRSPPQRLPSSTSVGRSESSQHGDDAFTARNPFTGWGVIRGRRTNRSFRRSNSFSDSNHPSLSESPHLLLLRIELNSLSPTPINSPCRCRSTTHAHFAA